MENQIPKPTRHENRSCLTKVKYLSKNAKETAKRMRLKFGERNIKPYRCEYCGYWHIGHVRPK